MACFGPEAELLLLPLVATEAARSSTRGIVRGAIQVGPMLRCDRHRQLAGGPGTMHRQMGSRHLLEFSITHGGSRNVTQCSGFTGSEFCASRPIQFTGALTADRCNCVKYEPVLVIVSSGVEIERTTQPEAPCALEKQDVRTMAV